MAMDLAIAAQERVGEGKGGGERERRVVVVLRMAATAIQHLPPAVAMETLRCWMGMKVKWASIPTKSEVLWFELRWPNFSLQLIPWKWGKIPSFNSKSIQTGLELEL